MAVFTKTVEIKVNKCERCGHEWQSRSRRKPKICPTCKRDNWNIPKVSFAAEAEGLR